MTLGSLFVTKINPGAGLYRKVGNFKVESRKKRISEIECGHFYNLSPVFKKHWNRQESVFGRKQ